MFRVGRKKKRFLVMGGIVFFVSVCAAAAFGIGFAAREEPAAGPVFSNQEQIAASIRRGLREHSRAITVTFECDREILTELSELVPVWMQMALQESSEPTEGDYIRYQYGGYQSSCHYDRVNGRYCYRVEILPEYYLYLVQEQEITEKVKEILDGFGFDEDTSDYEKIRTIYDYVCRNIRYDTVHQKNPYYHMRSTSYAALIQRTATCQGYCVTLYRMLREVGIPARVVTGIGRGDLHAWNVVELDGRYYYLDATWDAGQKEYTYFLRGSRNFSEHILGAEFLEPAFARGHPISETDHPLAETP